VNSTIGIILIDDSAIVRQVLSRELARQTGIEVLGVAADPIAGRELLLERRPQVVLLDLELPRMDGVTFLRRLMKFHPLPVIVCSASTGRGGATAIECLEAGAFEVLAKPVTAAALPEFVVRLTETIRAAAKSAIRPSARSATPVVPPIGVADATALVAIGASTGGTDALRTILAALPADAPPIAVVQHMPAGFTKPFADRLDALSAIRVREAADGDPLRAGLALIAPGGRQTRVIRDGATLRVRVIDAPPVKRHRPSVEVLFTSAAAAAGARAMGVLLTGMGDDGADGMRTLADAGALTVAQDEASCVVFGMPKAAIAAGGVREVLPLEQIARRIRDFAAAPRRAA
jgi:two-component system chemotaxis response regulator CheB